MRKKRSAKKYIATLSKQKQSYLHEIEILTSELMQKHNVEHYKFKFSRRRNAAGYCTNNTIMLNVDYCLRVNKEKIINTILHEIAHAVVGVTHGHRKIWQDKARDLGVTWTINYKE